MEPSTNTIKTLILNHTEPLIFKQLLNWDILHWDLQHWNDILGNRNLSFRCGNFEYTKESQWERITKPIDLSFSDFLEFETTNPNQWIYFDYKYLREHLKDVKELQDAISWNRFGFPELSTEDSTIWIGSKGAHTPCHVDTYGCNLIAQIYGRKRWILFPPQENLLPTRVPYEESSIYSKLNLFSPDVTKFKGLTKAMSVVLNPGEVLFLPHGWWHYVENLETAISINVWIPLPIDDEKRLEESLVQLVVSQFIKDLTKENRSNILNPNLENQQLHEYNFMQAIETVYNCGKPCQRESRKKLKTTDDANINKPCCELLKANSNAVVVPYLSEEEFQVLLHFQRTRFPEADVTEEKDNEVVNKISNLIDAFTDVNVINIIKNKILRMQYVL